MTTQEKKKTTDLYQHYDFNKFLRQLAISAHMVAGVLLK